MRKFDISNTDEFLFIESLYTESFPLSERRPIEKMLDLYKGESSFVVSMLYHRERMAGFLTYWDFDEFIYAEHFAISLELRNEGLGGKTMELFLKRSDKPVVLEVELPTTILSERRIGFYQRIGFRYWGNIQYHQPSYHNDDNTVPMKLMSYGNIDLEKDLVKIRSKIYKIAYNC